MMLVTISGILQEDCEMKADKKGHEYIRFRLSCRDDDMSEKPAITTVRCFTYNTIWRNLKKGDYIIINGTLKVSTYNEKMNIDVYVSHITKGIINIIKKENAD